MSTAPKPSQEDAITTRPGTGASFGPYSPGGLPAVARRVFAVLSGSGRTGIQAGTARPLVLGDQPAEDLAG